MRIVGRDKLEAFCSTYADARPWLEAWIQEAGGMSWGKPQDIKARYPSASFLPGNTVIFNVKGNNYRLEVNVAYKTKIVAILWIGTHRDYDDRNRKR